METTYLEGIQRQKQDLLDTQKEKGHLPTIETSRRELEVLFRPRPSMPSSRPSGLRVLPLFINFAYPPSTTPVAVLKPISISDLRLETHHLGKLLVVRTFGNALRAIAVRNAVEDAHGEVSMLTVYHEVESLNPEEVLPKGTVFVIKEPYYENLGTGHGVIRIDHPSDLIRLEFSDAQIQTDFLPHLEGLGEDAMNHKVSGNAAYARKDHRLALQMYTRGIAICEPGTSLYKDLLRNRSIVNTLLGRYEAAEMDAKAAMLESHDAGDSKVNALNSKALYRAGRAAYGTAKYQEAMGSFSGALELTPDDEDLLREYSRCSQRIEESTCGNYNFERMSKAATKKHNRLDHADFISNTNVRDTGGNRGRGRFAIKGIKAGELILCEKAFDVVTDSNADRYILLNVNTNQGNAGPYARLLTNIIEKLRFNPKDAVRFMELYDGGHQPKSAPQVIDNTAAVDSFRVLAIIEYNSFGCPPIRPSDNHMSQTYEGTRQGELPESLGIWVAASYLNHSCLGNTCYSFIGDMMILRATRDIAKDEEITMSYTIPKGNFDDLTKLLKEKWGIECDCVLCMAESKTPLVKRERRAKLIQDADALVFSSAHKDKSQPATAAKPTKPAEAIVRRAKRLYQDLEGTYPSNLFRGLPRLGLVDLGIWLCECQCFSSHADIVDACNQVLLNSGYGISSRAGTLDLDRTHAVLNPSAIDAAVHAADALRTQDQDELAKQYEALARELWVTLHGSHHGFDERLSLLLA